MRVSRDLTAIYASTCCILVLRRKNVVAYAIAISQSNWQSFRLDSASQTIVIGILCSYY